MRSPRRPEWALARSSGSSVHHRPEAAGLEFRDVAEVHAQPPAALTSASFAQCTSEVDADACPTMIKDILYRATERWRILLTLVTNENLRECRGYGHSR